MYGSPSCPAVSFTRSVSLVPTVACPGTHSPAINDHSNLTAYSERVHHELAACNVAFNTRRGMRGLYFLILPMLGDSHLVQQSQQSLALT